MRILVENKIVNVTVVQVPLGNCLNVRAFQLKPRKRSEEIPNKIDQSGSITKIDS